MTYGYIRVSTDKQDVDNQKIGINRRARELGVAIDEWISDDGVSGVKEYSDRQLGVLMQKIREGDTIIVSEISRLARSVFMLFRIVEHCIQIKNSTIYSVKESQVLRKDDVVSAIILSAYGTAAQIEREMIVKRTLEGLERRRMDGVVFGRPIGSKNTLKLEGRQEDIEKDIEKGFSLSQIARNLDVNISTLRRFCQQNGIIHLRSGKLSEYNRKNKECKKNMIEWIETKRDYVLQLSNEGAAIKTIILKLKEEKQSLNRSAFIAWFYDSGARDEIAAINKNIRSIRNVGCGKNKIRYSMEAK